MEIVGLISAFLHSIPEWLSSFISALIGAIVGGIFTLRGVDKEAKITRRQAEKESLELQLSVLKGTKGEVSILLALYDERMKEAVEAVQPDKPLNVFFPIGDDNFTFYEQNAKEIAKLKDESRDAIISIYTYARSLIQSYKANNKFIDEYGEAFIEVRKSNHDKFYVDLLNEKFQLLATYGQAIKTIDGETRRAIQNGFNTMDLEIKRIENELSTWEKVIA